MIITNVEVSKVSTLNINHRRWHEALDQIYLLLTVLSPGEVLCITGPSRIGKTKLMREAITFLLGPNHVPEPGVMQYVATDAVNCSTNGTFSTKSFTKRLLVSVEHPFLGVSNFDSLIKQDRISEDSYRQALELALIARKVKYLFIDEAQHARFVTKSAQGAYAVMDSWKCLAQVCGVVLVIIGAYPILDIIRNSPHMVGRKHQVHISRYLETDEDLLEFKWILEQYGQAIGEEDLLVNHLETLYKGSLGCIGLLRKWLMEALVEAASKRVGLTKSILDNTMPTIDDLRSLAKEISHGESLLKVDIVEKQVKSNASKEVVKKTVKKKIKPFKRKTERIELSRRSEGCE